MKSPAKKNLVMWQCPYCNDGVDDQDECVDCYVCKNWCHKTCTKMPDATFDCLSDTRQPNLQWICKPCMEGATELRTKQEARMEKLLELIPLFQTMSDRLQNLEKSMGEQLEEKIEEVVERKLEEKMEEMMEVEKRKKNLVIVNMAESTKTEIEECRKDDLAAAKKILSAIADVKEGDISEPIRLGKKGLGSRPRMLKITMKEEGKKKEILKNAPKLNQGKSQGETKIYVNEDLTRLQREKHKALRDELKRRKQDGEANIAIRNWRIVELPPKSDTDSTNSATVTKAEGGEARKDTN